MIADRTGDNNDEHPDRPHCPRIVGPATSR